MGKSLPAHSDKRTPEGLTLQVVESIPRFVADVGISNEDFKSFPIRAMFYCDRPGQLITVDPEFVLALVRPGDMVYIVLNADDPRSYTNSVRFLGSKGIRFTAKDLSRKSNKVEVGTVYAFSTDPAIIRGIFDANRSWFASTDFLFYLAPEGAEELWLNPSLISSVRHDFLMRSYCFLVTYFDHGMDVIAKTNFQTLEQAAQRVASLTRLPLSIKQH